MRRPALLAMLATLVGLALACAGRHRADSTPVPPRGFALLQVYVAALPREAAGIVAEVATVEAVGAGGSAVALELGEPILDGTAERRQKLLALGALPPGDYAGLRLGLGWARLGSAAEATELSVPPQPIEVGIAFSVERDGAAVVTLALSRESPIAGADAFEPAFTAGVPHVAELAPGATAIATSNRNATLTVLHKLTGEVFDVLRTAAGPRAASYDARTQRAFVACADADVIEVFDLQRRVLEQSFPLAAGDEPSGLAVSADGSTVVTANSGSNTVSVLDGPVLAERFRVQVGQEPVAVLLDAEARRAVVFLYGADSLVVIDLGRGVPLATIPTDAGPIFGAFDRDGRDLLVIHREAPFVDVVDLAGLRVSRRVNVGIPSRAIAVDPRTNRVFLGQPGTGRIEIYDRASLLPIERLDVGEDVSFLAVEPGSGQLAAALPHSKQLRFYRVEGGPVIAVTDLADAASWIDVAADDDGR